MLEFLKFKIIKNYKNMKKCTIFRKYLKLLKIRYINTMQYPIRNNKGSILLPID